LAKSPAKSKSTPAANQPPAEAPAPGAAKAQDGKAQDGKKGSTGNARGSGRKRPARLGRGLTSLMATPVSIQPPADTASAPPNPAVPGIPAGTPAKPGSDAEPSPEAADTPQATNVPQPPATDKDHADTRSKSDQNSFVPGRDPAPTRGTADTADTADTDSADAASPAEPASPSKPRPATQSPAPPESPGQVAGGIVPADDRVQHVPVEAIVPNPHQPRHRFDEAGLRRLADSILADGLMQPITVRILSESEHVSRPDGDVADRSPDKNFRGRFELVAGERRWRAAQLAGLITIPAIVRALDDRQSAEWALIENLQREDLNPVERAFAFQGLTEQFGLTQQQIAERLGLDRSSVSNTLRLLALTPKCHQLIIDGRLSMSQARCIAALTDPEAQDHLAQRAVKEGLSVRAVESIARKLAAPLRPSDGKAKPKPTAAARAGQIADVENALSAQLGTKVTISLGKKKGSGTLNIAFYNLDHFDQLLTRLGLQAGE